ncbi:2-hydroxychromene-2-carboxylate isomerase [Polaromonas sp.]|uniref:2-hydroxychromene-2-carboxylate isomerase n=1 Tax=Polaromonas sp. TaxID=1869339 RepID=UPI0035659479
MVDLFWSFRSPYSYLALHHVRKLAAANEVQWNVRIVRPLAIRTPDFFRRMDPLWRPYLLIDTKRISEQLGMPFARPTPDPVTQDPRTLVISDEQPYIHRLNRLGAEATLRGRALEFINEVSDLLWNGKVVGWDQGDHLAKAVARAGLDLREMEADIESDTRRRDLLIEQNETDLRAAGHWGVPTFVFEGEPFFGQDRLDLMRWRISQKRERR